MGVSEYNSALRLLLSIINNKSSTKPVLPPFEKPAIEETPVLQPFERCRPEETGVSSVRIREFLQTVHDDPTINMHSIIILKDGKIITEAAFGANRTDIAKLMFSASKSVVSLLFGILIGEGKATVDEKLIDIFSDKTTPITKLQIGELTVKDVLTMRSGIIFNEAVSMVTEDWVRGYLSSPVQGKIGESFNYNSMNTYMIVAIIDRKCGVGFEKYLETKLFEPLGITGTYWEKSPAGLPKGGWGLYMKPEDMAKLGQMVMDGGVWKGRRIVPEDYLKQALSRQAAVPEDYGDFDYGFQIWCGRKKNSFLFNGMMGQNVLAFCDNRIILVTNGGCEDNFQQSNYFKYAARYFGGKIKDGTARNDTEYRGLGKYIGSLSAYKTSPSIHGRREWKKNKVRLTAGAFVPRDDNKTTGLLPVMMQVYLNTYTKGLEYIRLYEEGHHVFLIYKEKDAVYSVKTGLESTVESELKGETFSFRTAAKTTVRYDEDENLVVTVRIDFIETPLTQTIKLRFTKEGVMLEQKENPGGRYVVRTFASLANEISMRSIVTRPVKKLDTPYLQYRIKTAFEPNVEMDIKYIDERP